MSDIYDPFVVSDDDAAGGWAKQLAQRWKSETKDGREFEKHFASRPENVEALAAVFDTLDEQVSFESLSSAYRALRQSGRIQSETEVEQSRLEAQRQQDEANRLKWESQCQSWLESHSTREITERAKTDRAFASYLKAANKPLQLPVEYSPENLARQRKAEQIQKERDRQDATVPEEVRAFAKQYQKMPFSQVQREMRDLTFRKQVEQAARAGLI